MSLARSIFDNLTDLSAGKQTPDQCRERTAAMIAEHGQAEYDKARIVALANFDKWAR